MQKRPLVSDLARVLFVFRFVCAALFLSSLLAPAAHAHMGSTKTVHARLTDEGAELRVEVESIDASIALGMGTSAGDRALVTHAGLLRGWLADGLVLAGQGGACSSNSPTPEIVGRDGRRFLAFTLDYVCAAPIGSLQLRDDTVFDDDPQHQTVVKIVSPSGTDVRILTADQRSVVLSRAPAATDTAAAFVGQGAVHLWTGYDHLLFLLSLLLAAGLVSAQVGFRKALRDIAVIVTAFTLGHSVSLVAATLGWAVLPTRVVESAIAASIIAIAVLNVARPQATMARPWLALVFGVVHGFGFSSVLAEVGLPTTHRVLALFSFNLGIELAQLVFVAVLLLPLAVLAPHRAYRPLVMQGGSLVIAAFGCMWLVERALGW